MIIISHRYSLKTFLQYTVCIISYLDLLKTSETKNGFSNTFLKYFRLQYIQFNKILTRTEMFFSGRISYSIDSIDYIIILYSPV